ncbi:MAG TPA: hypothetical protein IAB01_06270 [Candidatus Avidesulfovibrio excrementigallinarum]|nr:hypothetical protein [Candidatus Avidesulfovibrio excrementigallinarum]
MATTQRRTGLRAFFVCILVLVLAGAAAVPLFQYFLEQKIQQSLTTNPNFTGTLENVDYSLLSNRLTLSGLSIKQTSPLPGDVSCALIVVEGVDRVCLLDFLLNRGLADMPPTLRVDEVELRQLAVNLDDLLSLSLEHRTLSNISIDTQRLLPLLKKQRNKAGKDRSKESPNLSGYNAIVSCMSYDHGAGRDLQIRLADMPSMTVQIDDIAEFEVKGSSFAYSEVRGIHVLNTTSSGAGNAQPTAGEGKGQDLAYIGRLAVEGFSCSLDLLEADVDSLTEEESLAYLKQLFLGEKPFVRCFIIDDLQAALAGNARVSMKNLTWTNSTTSPFDCSLSIQGFSLPTTSFPSLGLLGYKQLDLNGKVALKLPTLEAGSASCELTFDGKNVGALTWLGDYDILDPKQLYSGDPRSAAIVSLTLDVKDGGILERLEHLAALFTGKQSLSASMNDLVASMPEKYRTPVNLKNLEAVQTFLTRSGSIKCVFAPEKPLTLDQLQDDTVFFNALTVTANPAKPAAGSNTAQ